MSNCHLGKQAVDPRAVSVVKQTIRKAGHPPAGALQKCCAYLLLEHC